MSINKFNYRKFSFVLFQDAKKLVKKLASIEKVASKSIANKFSPSRQLKDGQVRRTVSWYLLSFFGYSWEVKAVLVKTLGLMEKENSFKRKVEIVVTYAFADEVIVS